MKIGRKIYFAENINPSIINFLQIQPCWPVVQFCLMLVNVDAPSVTVRERTVHTSLGEEEELVCRVTGVPSPSLTWYRDNNVIDRRTANVLLNQRAGRHSLTLLNIDQASVGDYQCVASNSEGNVTESITLTGN